MHGVDDAHYHIDELKRYSEGHHQGRRHYVHQDARDALTLNIFDKVINNLDKLGVSLQAGCRDESYHEICDSKEHFAIDFHFII